MNDKQVYTDHQIIEGIKSGNNSFHHKFVDNYGGLIYSLCLDYADNSGDADEMFNDILLKILTKIDTYDATKSSLKTWICKITKNHLKDYSKKKGVSVKDTCNDDYDIETYQDDFPFDKIYTDQQDYIEDTDEDLALLNVVLQSISKRDILIMQFRSDGLSFKEIAELLDMNEPAAKTAYSRSYRRVKENFLLAKSKGKEEKN